MLCVRALLTGGNVPETGRGSHRDGRQVETVWWGVLDSFVGWIFFGAG